MTGYVETCEIMNDCADVAREVARDLNGLQGALRALAALASSGAAVSADTLALLADQALAMHGALEVACEYMAAGGGAL